MSSIGSGNTAEWGEEQKARLKRERDTLDKRMETLNKTWEEFEADKKQLRTVREEEGDLEYDVRFPRLVGRAITRIGNKQEELDKRRNELMKKMKKLDGEERGLKALLEHEKYPKWLDLKKKRDAANEEVARLDAEMKLLMESIMNDTEPKS